MSEILEGVGEKAVAEYCDVCGINMTDRGCTAIGKDISVQGDHKEFQRVENAFGKTDFKICFVCWLKSLGIKENDETKKDTAIE